MNIARVDAVGGSLLFFAAIVLCFNPCTNVGWCEGLASTRPDTQPAASTRPTAGTKPTTRSGAGTLEVDLVFPGHSTQKTIAAIWRNGPTDELLTLHTKDGVRIAAVFGKGVRQPQDVRTARSQTLIYFYGNGSCMAGSRTVFNQFRRDGFDVIMADYPGYGMSDGRPSESGCYAAADAVYDYLLHRAGVDQTRIVLVGWSLGSAVAIDLAARRPVQSLILFSALTNIPDVASRSILGIAAPLILTSRFDSLSKIPAVSCPIMMFHGTDDTFVPPEMSDRLAAAAKTKATVVRVPHAGHNNIFSVGGATLFGQVKKFVKDLKASGQN